MQKVRIIRKLQESKDGYYSVELPIEWIRENNVEGYLEIVIHDKVMEVKPLQYLKVSQ